MSREPGVAKFDLHGYDGTPLTMADAIWTATLDSAGRASTMVLARGADLLGFDDAIYFVVARPAAAGVQGIYRLGDLNNRTPVIEFIYADKDDNVAEFRADITLDAAGNIIFFENSDEEVVLISPPAGENSFTTAWLDTLLRLRFRADC